MLESLPDESLLRCDGAGWSSEPLLSITATEASRDMPGRVGMSLSGCENMASCCVEAVRLAERGGEVDGLDMRGISTPEGLARARVLDMGEAV